jgi:hypothetical protein
MSATARTTGWAATASGNNRLLGTVCMLGGAVAVMDSLRWWVLGLSDSDTLTGIVFIVWAIGSIAGLLGLIALNVVGASPVTRALAMLPVLGFALLAATSVLQLAGLIGADNPIFGVGWLLIYGGMVLVAILTLAAKTWRDWRRFAPLLTVVAAPIGFGLGALVGNLGLGVGLIYLFWVLLGHAVRTAQPVPVPQTEERIV